MIAGGAFLFLAKENDYLPGYPVRSPSPVDGIEGKGDKYRRNKQQSQPPAVFWIFALANSR
jgi:hypothetical protein